MNIRTAILVSWNLIPSILKQGMIKEGKAQFVILEGLVNSRDMATTWRKLFLDQNLEATHKVVEKMDSVGPRFMLKKEVTLWHHLTLKYGLLHTWQLAEA